MYVRVREHMVSLAAAQVANVLSLSHELPAINMRPLLVQMRPQ